MAGPRERGRRSGASRVGALLIAGLAAGAGSPGAAEEPRGAEALSELPIERLLSVEVTIATRQAQRLFDSAAAVYVITAEDLRRSGATSLPEALRMVPGLQVARAGSSRWAISARGFTDEFANKLLVLVDGRTVYTPLFAGVHWDAQDVLLEDVERIEVVRGPGAALWGANAVNGVINIVTRQARHTQGALVTAEVGTADRAVGGVRYGGSFGAEGHYRAWAKYFDRASFQDPAGVDVADRWDVGRAGAGAEWRGTGNDLSLEGELYRGDIRSTSIQSSLQPPYTVESAQSSTIHGGHVMGLWERHFTLDSRAELRAYYDHTERGDTLDSRDIFDVEMQRGWRSGRHRPLLGIGYRRTSDDIGASPTFSFTPPARTLNLYSGFLQDEVDLAGGVARLIAGVKLEHNSFTGFEVQPSARLAWYLGSDQVVWGAVSRAVRTPSRADENVRYLSAVFPAGGVLNQVTIIGNPSVVSEELVAWELGYRVRLGRTLSCDFAAFLNDYGRLRSFEPESPLPGGADTPNVVVLPQRVDSGLVGRTWGAELSAEWVALPGWRLAASYAHLRVDTWAGRRSQDANPEALEGDSPRHQLHLRSFADLPGGLELDATLYYASSLPNRGAPAWTRVDLMLGWRSAAALDLRIGVQNVLGGPQLEFGRDLGGRVATEIPQAVYAKAVWRF